MSKSQFDVSKIFELLDEGVDSVNNYGQSFLWGEQFREGNFISIPKLVDKNPSFWRSKYLNWTNQLSNSIIDGKTLYFHFNSSLINGNSFWWQTLIADKCPYKTKSPFEIIKIWIIEELYCGGEFDTLIYRGNNIELSKVLSDWINKNKLGKFIWDKEPQRLTINISFIFEKTPAFILGIYHLTVFLIRKIRYFEKRELNFDAKITIVTYYPGVDINKIKDGIFHSNYWGPLNEYLNEIGTQVNWIWLYSKQQLSLREAVKYQRELNIKSSITGKNYLFLENNLTISNIFSIVREYIKFGFKSLFILSKIKKEFQLTSSGVNFLPILKREWNNSFWGEAAVLNYIYAASFKNLQLPVATEKVLYVWENQPWEQSLLSLKDLHPNISFLGSVHTPANAAFFNLKVFPGNVNEFYLTNGRKVPDFICAPSIKAKEVLVNGGWPANNVIIAEALRYIDSLNFDISNNNQLCIKSRNLLVVTGSILKEVEGQLKLVYEFEKKNPAFFDKIIVKSHPIIPVNNILRNLGSLSKIEITDLKLSQLWSSSCIVFTANSTSVGLEAYYLGLPLIVSAPVDNFNLSALFGMNNVFFVNTFAEFSESVEHLLNSIELNNSNPSDVFCIDNNLNIWKSLLGPSM